MNRKDRRNAERSMGLLKENSKKSWSARKEIYDRKRKIGKKIHNENVERIHNQQLEEEDRKYTQRMIDNTEV